MGHGSWFEGSGYIAGSGGGYVAGTIERVLSGYVVGSQHQRQQHENFAHLNHKHIEGVLAQPYAKESLAQVHLKVG